MDNMKKRTAAGTAMALVGGAFWGAFRRVRTVSVSDKGDDGDLAGAGAAVCVRTFAAGVFPGQGCEKDTFGLEK